MPDYTSRLKLIKPLGGEDVEVSDLNANADVLDTHPGTFICTSTTRPANPFNGQQIYETNTKSSLVWDGSDWLTLSTSSTSRRVFEPSSYNSEVSAGTGGFAPRATEIAPNVFSLKGRVFFTGSLNPVPSTLRWFYLPSAATPTGAQNWVQVNAAIGVNQRAVVFRINSSNYEDPARRNAVEMMYDLPASVSSNIFFDSVYTV